VSHFFKYFPIIKYTLLTAVCTLLLISVSGQAIENNLISNPSLDEVESCPDNPFYFANGTIVNDWWYWLLGSRGGSQGLVSNIYFNMCNEDIMNGTLNSFGASANFKPISPRSGSGYCFITSKSGEVPDHDFGLRPSLDTIDRNFLKNHLTAPLEEGKTYLFFFYQRGVRWMPNYTSDIGKINNCASSELASFFSVDSNLINSASTTRRDLFSIDPQIEWESYTIDTNEWTLMVGCFTAEGGEQFMTLGRFNQESESDLEDCQDYFLENNGDSIFFGTQTERLFVDDFGLYDLETFTFEDKEHCLLDSFYFEDPYEMGFLAVYEDDTLNQGWVAPGPGTYEIDVIIGHCKATMSFEIDVSPCQSCLPEIQPVALCPEVEYFNPSDYVDVSFQVPDTLIKACPGIYEFPALHPHCSGPVGVLEIQVRNYLSCYDELPLTIQCIGTELDLPEGDRFFLDVGGYPIPSRWQEPAEIPFQFFDDFCETEVESGTMRVIKCEDCDIYIPNVFSPNGDGINDYFEISTACDVQSAQVQIFDRQGRLIRESRQLDRIWDGRQEQPGVYIYRAQIEHTVAEGTQLRNLSGSLTLVR